MPALSSALVRAVLIAVVVAGVSACSDPTPPAKITRTSATPTASSPSPSPTALTPEQEVEATMRAYFVAANRMFRTGDVEELRSFSAPNCPCRAITDTVEKVVRSGGHYDGSTFILRDLNVHDVIGGSAAAEVRATVPPYRVLDASGKVIEDSGGGTLHTDFSLTRTGERWLITNAVNLG